MFLTGALYLSPGIAGGRYDAFITSALETVSHRLQADSDVVLDFTCLGPVDDSTPASSVVGRLGYKVLFDDLNALEGLIPRGSVKILTRLGMDYCLAIPDIRLVTVCADGGCSIRAPSHPEHLEIVTLETKAGRYYPGKYFSDLTRVPSTLEDFELLMEEDA